MNITNLPITQSDRLFIVCFGIKFCNSTISIMYKHTGVGDVVGMEISDFEVVGRFGRFELLQRYAFHFAKRAVGKKNFIAML